jgi:hypothetical protein
MYGLRISTVFYFCFKQPGLLVQFTLDRAIRYVTNHEVREEFAFIYTSAHSKVRVENTTQEATIDTGANIGIITKEALQNIKKINPQNRYG